MKKGVWEILIVLTFIIFLSYLIFATSLSSDSTSTSEWRMFGRTLNHNNWDGVNYSILSYLKSSSWISPLYGSFPNMYPNFTFSMPPTIANGYVYLGTNSGNRVFQFNASNVSQLVAQYPTTGDVGIPAVANGSIYVNDNSYLYQLNATNISSKIASYSAYSMSSPVIANGYVYVGGYHNLYQFNASNVSQKIANYSSNYYFGIPAVANGYVYVGNGDGYIYQLNASNVSQKIANSTTGSGITSSPTIANGYVYIGNSAGDIFQLNATNISQLFASYITSSTLLSSAAIANGYVYISGYNANKIYQLNATNISNSIATFSGGGVGSFNTPSVTDKYVYVGEQYDSVTWVFHQLNATIVSQQINEISMQNGDIAYEFSAIANGYVYIGVYDTLYQLWAENISLQGLTYLPPPPTNISGNFTNNGEIYFIGSVANRSVNLSLICSLDICSETLYCIDTADSCTPNSTYYSQIQISSTNYVRFKSNYVSGFEENVTSEYIPVSIVALPPSTTWSQCNPADPCCDINGYLRSSGYVCRSAHDAVCDNSGSCSGHAYEDRCDGTSSICPDNHYEINYSKICDDLVCVAQSCSGFTLQPERTCGSGICQINNPFDCPNNLNCLNSISCKKEASSSSDCKTDYSYSSQYKVCLPDNENETLYGMVYDNNGNLISGFGLNSSYNGFNQLINVTDSVTGNLIAKYFYGSDGNRVKSIVYSGEENTTTYYFNNFVQIINSSGVYNESYYYYYDKLVGKKDINGNTYFYYPDALGSTSLITDSSGNAIANLSYEPFGKLMQDSGERYTFTGHEIDPELNLLYMKTRYYNPSTGQFTQPDTIIQDVYNPQNLNKYAYVVNNPYRYTDPNGEFFDIIFDIASIFYDIYTMITEPSNHLNYVSFGADVVAAFIPGVTGVGATIRASSKIAKGIDKANDLRRTTSKINNVGKTANKVQDVTRTTSKTNDLRGAANPFVKERIGKGITQHNALTASARSQGLKANEAVFKEIGSLARPDVIDIQKGIITELKPNNPLAIAKGEKQIQKYTDLAKKTFPEIKSWEGRVITYD